MAARNGQADAFAARPLLKDQRTKFRLGPRSENDPVADMRRFSIELGVLRAAGAKLSDGLAYTSAARSSRVLPADGRQLSSERRLSEKQAVTVFA
jgi:hypothetical protein